MLRTFIPAVFRGIWISCWFELDDWEPLFDGYIELFVFELVFRELVETAEWCWVNGAGGGITSDCLELSALDWGLSLSGRVVSLSGISLSGSNGTWPKLGICEFLKPMDIDKRKIF